MSSDDTELTFIRCPGCRSLVPAVATRCRMCGQVLTGSKEQKPEAQSPQPEAPEKKRVRQKTLSLNEEEVSTVKETVQAQKSRAHFDEEETHSSVSKFLQMSDREEEEIPVPSARQTRQAPEKTPERQPEKQTPQRNEQEPFRLGRRPAAPFTPPRVEKTPPPPVVEEDDEYEVDEEDFEDDIEGEAEEESYAPAFDSSDRGDEEEPRKRKRKRKRKKKKPQQGLEQAQPAQSVQVQPPRREPIPEPQRPEPPRQERRDFVKKPEIPVEREPYQPVKPRVQPQEPPRRQEAPVYQHPQVEEQTVEQRQVKAQPMNTAEQIRTPKVKLEGRLIGWLVTFRSDFRGAPIEIREGRFFVGGAKVRDTDLVLADDSLSVPHCLVKAEAKDGLVVQDLMSERGTFVKRQGSDNYELITVPTIIEHGDWLKFGEFEVMACIVPEEGRRFKS